MRRTITIIIIVIALAAGGYYFYNQRQAQQEGEIEILREATVERGQISATVNATGSMEPEAIVSPAFGLAGTVRQVNVIRGQQVSAGDVLATLDSEEMALAVQQAEDALRIQELSLEQVLRSEPSAATLATAQADIDAAEGNRVVAEANLAAAQASVAQAQAAKAQLQAGPTAGQIAAAESQLAQAELAQKTAQETYNRTIECFTVPEPGGGEEEQCPGLGAPEEQARANLNNANAALEAAQAQLNDVLAGPRLADLQAADAAIAAAEAQVAAAEGSILVAEANVDRAEAAFQRLQEGPTAEEIAVMEAQVDAAETNLALARLRLEQSMIVAPIDGRVASVQINPGEKVTPGAPAVSIVNENAFHIEVSVDEIDIDQIAVGQDVDITLDALPDTIVVGQIAEIAPTALGGGGGVVTYLVTINIDAQDEILRPGMTANASIVVEEIDDVLTVPNWAVRLDRETGEAFVNRLQSDGAIEEVSVTTGLRNEQFSEVVSGLQAGDTVVVTNERESLSFFGGG